MTEHTGWLLDLYEDPLGGLVVWFLDDTGERRRLRQRFPVTFYVLGPANILQIVEKFLSQQPFQLSVGYEVEHTDVFARRKVRALAVEVARPADLAPLFRRVSQAFPDLDYADADLQLSLRYAAVTGVSPLCRCRIELDARDVITAIQYLESPWELDPSAIPMRVMTLAPDVDPSHRKPQSLHVQIKDRTFCFSFASARALLVNLQSLLLSEDPDLLLTSWGDTWLMPLLLNLAEEQGLPLALNRDPDAAITRRKERWYFSYGQIIYRGEQVHLFGRWHLDCHNAMLWSDFDLDGVLETARVTGLPLQTAARVSPGTGISAIQMLAALRNDVLVPWQKQQAEMLKPAADLFSADQGGLVFQPVLGVHRDVASIDFISMYPAIITYFNLSPETINAGGPSARRVPALNLTIDQETEGIVPLALRPLLEKRVALRRRQSTLPAWDPRRKTDKQRSSALKWLLVTCFGYLGYKNARFGRIEAHQAVTAYGREALLLAKEAAEESGGEVLHAYVDSLFVRWPELPTQDKIEALLAVIQARTGLPIALDGVYRWVVFLPSRVNPHRPVPNRYFGVFYNGELKIRGIALRRRDTAPWIAGIQSELLDLLARTDPPEAALPAAVHLLRQRLADLRGGRVPLAELLVTFRISREVEDYRSHSPTARVARELNEIGKRVKPGQSVRFLYTLGEPGVYAWDMPASPAPAMIDFARYRVLLLRAAAEVLAPFGLSEEELMVLTDLSTPLPDPENTAIPLVQSSILMLNQGVDKI